MAAPTYAAVGTHATNAAATSRDYALPSGVVAGSVVIVLVYSEDTAGTVTPPAGYSLILESKVTAGSGDHKLQAYWHRASGNESGSVTFTQTNNAWFTGYALRFEGCVASGNPYEAGSTGTGVAVTAYPDASVTTTTVDTRAVYVVGLYAGPGTLTAPSGFTNRWPGSSSIPCYVKDAATDTATTVSITDGSSTNTQDQTSMAFALTSVAAGGGTITNSGLVVMTIA